MKITYWSDYACPYCYIGETHLKKAIDNLELQDVEIEMKAFELDPSASRTVQGPTVDRFAVKYGLTKAQARELGWGDTYSSVDDAAPGKSIGGDRFGNREGLLPKKKGRTYTECDIGTMGKKSRGAKRIVFSNDGLIYYTDDHYESFEQLYDGWED